MLLFLPLWVKKNTLFSLNFAIWKKFGKQLLAKKESAKMKIAKFNTAIYCVHNKLFVFCFVYVTNKAKLI